ncbi:MAG: 4-hydroxy-3-methylbut-2-enyl diphosphate reductase, partial [Spirochaetales bacterium]|nr:4-hydroxy-3-methylbut-2-enyl diphosphate reductase [Spirochaetales bacterium]
AMEMDENDEAPAGSVVIVRSHGVPPATIKHLEEGGALIVNATCPRVTANQRAAEQFAAAGRLVVVAGDRGHGETISVAAHAPGALVVSSVDEARVLETDQALALLAQTTMSEREYDAIRDVLAARYADMIDGRGICGATHERQAAVRELVGQVEAVVVVGGANSANTRRLAELARSLGVPAWRIESADELPTELAAFKTVGLTAGASTPDADIDAVEAALLALSS